MTQSINPPAITLHWWPQEDITIYELALLLRYASGIDRPTPARFEQFPRDARRHFQMTYNPSNEAAVAWVEKWCYDPTRKEAT